MRLRKDTAADRKEEAKDRQEAYAKLSKKQKIAKLDEKLGKGVGAVKQRERLSGK